MMRVVGSLHIVSLGRLPELALVLRCLAHSLVQFLSTLAVLFFLLLLAAMWLSQMIIVSLTWYGQDGAVHDGAVHDEDLTRLYGSPWIIFFTLFSAITGGAEWGQLLAPLEGLSWWYRVAATVFISFMTIAALNIATAVVVSFCLRIRDHLQQKESWMSQGRDQRVIDQLRDLFNTKDRDGKISKRDCEKILRGRGSAHLKALDIDCDRAMNLFHILDADKNDRSDIEEFLFILKNYQNNASTMLCATVKHESTRILYQIEKLDRLIKQRFSMVFQENPDVMSVMSGSLEE